VLLSPFDGLIYDRRRTEELFGFRFRFRLEIYVPKDTREFGYFAMPILHGDRLIGRIDPTFDRAAGELHVRAVHAEPGAPGVGGSRRGSDDRGARVVARREGRRLRPCASECVAPRAARLIRPLDVGRRLDPWG